MTRIKKQLLVITVLLAAVMELIDISIVNVALSHMSGNLGSTIADTSWVITSYAIANVIIIPITSFLTNKLGRRNYYIGSIILFTICSFMCGTAGSIWVLVAFRFLQGLGGGALLSVSQAVVFEVFPKEKRAMASALFAIGVFTGPTIGPTLGGFITEYYSWPWIFFINVPIGIVAATSCYFLLTEPEVKTKVKGVDWTGIALLAIGVGSMQTVLERGQTEDWFSKGYITALTVTAILSLTGFVIWELYVDEPVVNLRVLKSKTLTIAAILTFVTGFGMFTSVFLTPVIAQRLLGFSPTETGLLLLPGAIIAIVALIVCGKLLQSGLSPVIIVAAGFFCFILFNLRMAGLNFDTPWNTISGNLIYRAMGMAFLTVPLTSLAVSSLTPADVPQGAALNNMMRQLGGSFGISIVNTYSERRLALHRVDLISHVTAGDPLTVSRLNGYTSYFQSKGGTWLDAHQKAMGLIDLNVVKQSTMLSYIDTYLLIGLLFVLALPLLGFVIRRPQQHTANVVVPDH